MSSSHNHSRKNIGFALGLNASFTLIEFIGGYLTGSVAIIADAFHDLGDTLTLVISYFMEKKSEKRPSEAYSYGYQRYSVLGALISGLILVSGSTIVVWEAFPLIFSPKENHPSGMMAVALLGIVANGLAFFRLHHGHSENEKMIKWHLFEDLAGWVADPKSIVTTKLFSLAVSIMFPGLIRSWQFLSLYLSPTTFSEI